MFRREGPKVSECARWTRVFACRFRCRSWLLTVLCGGRTRGVIRLNETGKGGGRLAVRCAYTMLLAFRVNPFRRRACGCNLLFESDRESRLNYPTLFVPGSKRGEPLIVVEI